MPDFPDKLRLKEQVEEDTYFARRDRERIKALREKRSAEEAEEKSARQKDQSGKPRRKTGKALTDRTD
jgi:hypothetical protein